jgi:hypothetical protein
MWKLYLRRGKIFREIFLTFGKWRLSLVYTKDNKNIIYNLTFSFSINILVLHYRICWT